MKAQDFRILGGGSGGKVHQNQGFRLIGDKPKGADANIGILTQNLNQVNRLIPHIFNTHNASFSDGGRRTLT